VHRGSTALEQRSPTAHEQRRSTPHTHRPAPRRPPVSTRARAAL
jgi:hypothetical protein